MYFYAIILAVISFVSCAPKPGYIGGYHGVPVATSYSSRVDFHEPVITKTIPIVKTVVPLSFGSPVLSGYGYGLGHDYHGDGYYGDGLGYSSGLGYGSGYYGNGLGYGLGGLGYGGGYGSGYYKGGLGYGGLGYNKHYY